MAGHFRINADKAHGAIRQVLNAFQFNPDEKEVVDQATDNAISILGNTGSKKIEIKKKKLSEVNQKIDKLKRGFLNFETDLFNELLSGFKAEVRTLEADIEALQTSRQINSEIKSSLLQILENLGDWFFLKDSTSLRKFSNTQG